MVGLRASRLVDVVDRADLAGEHDGDQLLTAELMAQALPAQTNPLGLELQAQCVHRVVGRHGDEEMGVDPFAPAVVERTDAGRAPAGARHDDPVAVPGRSDGRHHRT
jgi:hypothetical protein